MAGTGGEGRQSTAMRERRVVPAGGAAVLAEVAGRGMMSHLFLALSSPDPAGRSGCLVKIYVDGEETPAIVSDVDGLFGGFSGAVFKSRLIGCDGVSEAANGFGGYFYFDIPFAAGLRVELENGSAVAATQIWSIVSYALGGDQDRGRRRRLRNVNFARTAAMLAVPEYAEQTLAEIAGRGALFGLVFFLQCGAPSWRPLEGNFRFYVDGETAASWESS